MQAGPTVELQPALLTYSVDLNVSQRAILLQILVETSLFMAAHAHDDIMVEGEIDDVGLDGRPCASLSQPAAAIACSARAWGEES